MGLQKRTDQSEKKKGMSLSSRGNSSQMKKGPKCNLTVIYLTKAS